MNWFKRKPKTEVPALSTHGNIHARNGRWRFSHLDGRFVFDFDDGVHVGFNSDTFTTPDRAAELLNHYIRLLVEMERISVARREELDATRQARDAAQRNYEAVHRVAGMWEERSEALQSFLEHVLMPTYRVKVNTIAREEVGLPERDTCEYCRHPSVEPDAPLAHDVDCVWTAYEVMIKNLEKSSENVLTDAPAAANVVDVESDSRAQREPS